LWLISNLKQKIYATDSMTTMGTIIDYHRLLHDTDSDDICLIVGAIGGIIDATRNVIRQVTNH
jgi:hypothetical protein